MTESRNAAYDPSRNSPIGPISHPTAYPSLGTTETIRSACVTR